MKQNHIPPATKSASRRKMKGAAWVAVGVSLLVGGSTLALWNASDEINGGTITAGDLNVELADSVQHWDVSTDRRDVNSTTGIPAAGRWCAGYETTKGVCIGFWVANVPAHAIDDIDTWRLVPGDEVASTFDTTVTLEGDNLVGKLSVELGTEAHNPNVTHSFEVYRDGKELVSRTPIEDTADGVLYLSAPQEGQAAGKDDAKSGRGTRVYSMDATSELLTVIVYTEATDVNDREGVAAAEVLDFGVKFEQVRDTGSQFK